ncbi:MAG TPA: sugar ABC transporter permease [Candidatus Limnocylindria bacterium]|nr:sugar ABC transporter permease [Candidatus Limnocylindria bacterium]
MAAEVARVNARSAERRRRDRFEGIQAWIFVVPALAILLLFDVAPAAGSFVMSLFDWRVIQGPFRGLQNYADILDPGHRLGEEFLRSLSTTVTYTLLTVPIELAFSLVVAYVLFQKMRGRGIYRTIYYLPYITSIVAAAVVFTWLFNPNYGFFNYLLSFVGVGAQKWLDEPRGLFELVFGAFGVALPEWAAGPSLALVSISIFTVWHFIGFQIVIFLAGLGTISNEYYEAARLDGANERQLFFKITLPLLSPTTFFLATIATIGSLRSFSQIYVMTNGGPLGTTNVASYEIFRTFFQRGADFGHGAAMSFVLTAIIVAFTLFQFRFVERRVHYG